MYRLALFYEGVIVCLKQYVPKLVIFDHLVKKTANCVFVSIYSNLHFTCSIFDSILNWLIHLFSYFIKQHRIAVVSLHCLLWYGHRGHAIFILVWRMPLHPGVRDVISFLFVPRMQWNRWYLYKFVCAFSCNCKYYILSFIQFLSGFQMYTKQFDKWDGAKVFAVIVGGGGGSGGFAIKEHMPRKSAPPPEFYCVFFIIFWYVSNINVIRHDEHWPHSCRSMNLVCLKLLRAIIWISQTEKIISAFFFFKTCLNL